MTRRRCIIGVIVWLVLAASLWVVGQTWAWAMLSRATLVVPFGHREVWIAPDQGALRVEFPTFIKSRLVALQPQVDIEQAVVEPSAVSPVRSFDLSAGFFHKTGWLQPVFAAKPLLMVGEIQFAGPPPGRKAFSGLRVESSEASIPTKLLSLACLVPAGMYVLGWTRAPKYGRQGQCAWCGYDLRATPDRCPECGETVGGEKTGRDRMAG